MTHLLVWLLIAGVSPSSSFAYPQDHYCGVYSAYSVLQWHGADVDFESLLVPEYVSGLEGSTSSELVAAFANNGVIAKSYSGLGVFDLRTAANPLILHVRGSQATRTYGHWIVFFGETCGQPIVFDPSSGERDMSYAELLSMWDGIGVATSGNRLGLLTWRFIALSRSWCILVVLGALACYAVRCIDHRVSQSLARLPLLKSACSGVLLLIITMIGATLIDATDAAGVLANPTARASLSSVRSIGEFELIDLNTAKSLHSDANSHDMPTIWIDARYAADFAYAHIPRAISIPIDTSFLDEKRLCDPIPKASTIVVYCQSSRCGYAHAVATRLRSRGYGHILIFSPGYAEWLAAGNTVERPPKPGE